MMAVAVRNI